MRLSFLLCTHGVFVEVDDYAYNAAADDDDDDDDNNNNYNNNNNKCVVIC